DYGQGHATPFAQVLSEQLGVPFEKITLEQGDSDLVRFGNGTGGSRSITATGQAIVEASALVVEKGKKAAAHMLEASEADIEFGQGRFTIAGTDRSVSFADLAKRPGGDTAKMNASATFASADGHLSEWHPSRRGRDPDPATGIIKIVSYVIVDDFGVTLNPLMLAGQVHGGAMQGIGQA
ncbi:carbon monoxide dehydrogenase, partial [Streptomyces sp. Alain-F2R5]